VRIRHWVLVSTVIAVCLGAPSIARAQSQSNASPWFLDLGFGINPSINGNVNSGAIGTLSGQAIAVLPNSYGDVYGTGVDFRFGGGFSINKDSELRGMFIRQSADADLVRFGDLGPSSLYGQYSDYKSFALDVGYRRYAPFSMSRVRIYGEASIGVGRVDRINVQLAAPQSNVVVNNTDFYDGTAAFTWSLGGGLLLPLADQVDFNFQLGLRHVGGLADVDQLVGTALSDINNDSARLTFPIVVGVRFRFK
jgi:Outer membrane protein beta-barrel domain